MDGIAHPHHNPTGQISQSQFEDCFETVAVLGRSWLIDPVQGKGMHFSFCSCSRPKPIPSFLLDVFKKDGVLQRALMKLEGEIDADVLSEILTSYGQREFVLFFGGVGGVESADPFLHTLLLGSVCLRFRYQG